MTIFTANRASSNSNVLYPDILEVDDNRVIYHKGYVFGYKTIVILANNIASVSASSGLFFVDIIVASKGGEWIKARGFNKSKAKDIINTIEEIIK